MERSHRLDAEEFYRLLDGIVIDDTELSNEKLWVTGCVLSSVCLVGGMATQPSSSGMSARLSRLFPTALALGAMYLWTQSYGDPTSAGRWLRRQFVCRRGGFRRGHPRAEKDERKTEGDADGERFTEKEDAECDGNRRVDVGDDSAARRADLDDELENKTNANAVQTSANPITATMTLTEGCEGRCVRPKGGVRERRQYQRCQK